MNRPTSGLRFWRVTLTETIGGHIIHGCVRLVPAYTAAEARAKAIAFQKKRMPGSDPKVIATDEELHGPIGQTIHVRHCDEAP